MTVVFNNPVFNPFTGRVEDRDPNVSNADIFGDAVSSMFDVHRAKAEAARRAGRSPLTPTPRSTPFGFQPGGKGSPPIKQFTPFDDSQGSLGVFGGATAPPGNFTPLGESIPMQQQMPQQGGFAPQRVDQQPFVPQQPNQQPFNPLFQQQRPLNGGKLHRRC